MGTGLGSPLRVATGSDASRGLKPLRRRSPARANAQCVESPEPQERRFAPTTVRYRRISVRYESEQVSAFIGIRTEIVAHTQSAGTWNPS